MKLGSLMFNCVLFGFNLALLITNLIEHRPKRIIKINIFGSMLTFLLVLLQLYIYLI